MKSKRGLDKFLSQAHSKGVATNANSKLQSNPPKNGPLNLRHLSSSQQFLHSRSLTNAFPPSLQMRPVRNKTPIPRLKHIMRIRDAENVNQRELLPTHEFLLGQDFVKDVKFGGEPLREVIHYLWNGFVTVNPVWRKNRYNRGEQDGKLTW